MIFHSLSFLFIFLPVVVAVYYILRTTKYANLWLLFASLYFYSAEAVWFALPLLTSSLFDFFAGRYIHDSGSEKFRRRLLIGSVCVNLGFLAIFKYTTWMSGHISTLFALFGIAMTPIVIPLPPGISFYTFQSMSYTIDIYRGHFKPHRNLTDFLSFVSFFPQLIAGPIMRAKELLPQLTHVRPVPSLSNFSHAVYLVLFGLFMKLVIADNLGGITEVIETLIPADGSPLGQGLGLVFAYAFAFQIYCDFYAYSTIARGVGKMFGIHLMRNFNSPYFSTNPSEFWRRWHISLSSWLRDYLYITLGGNRGGVILTVRNLMLTMIIGGLWHGAGILFLVWGFYHGVLLLLYKVAPIDVWLFKVFGRRLGRFFATVVFFHLVVIGWVFFRAQPESVGPIFMSILLIPQAITDHIHVYIQYFTALPDFSLAYDAAILQDTLMGSLHVFTDKMVQTGYLWLSTIKGTVIGYFTSNWYLLVYGWGLVAFSTPIIMTDWVAWRKRTEFGDLFHVMPYIIRVGTTLFFFYAIVFLGKREAIDFIYFAF